MRVPKKESKQIGQFAKNLTQLLRITDEKYGDNGLLEAYPASPHLYAKDYEALLNLRDELSWFLD